MKLAIILKNQQNKQLFIPIWLGSFAGAKRNSSEGQQRSFDMDGRKYVRIIIGNKTVEISEEALKILIILVSNDFSALQFYCN